LIGVPEGEQVDMLFINYFVVKDDAFIDNTFTDIVFGTVHRIK